MDCRKNVIRRLMNMGKITVEECPIKGLKVIIPQVFGDERGYFMEVYNYKDYRGIFSIRFLLCFKIYRIEKQICML